jgi:GrpB-like predicted nucleotidyltransferase (UPF0157 family)
MEAGTHLVAGDDLVIVESARPHQNRWLVTFEGVYDRSGAERLRGRILFAEPIDDPDELWVHDLVGARVDGATGGYYGRVVAVHANPASDLLELCGGELVPVRFVTSSDRGRVVIDPPPGLIEPINDPIVIVDHDPEWAPRAAAEIERLGSALGAAAVRIDHVGSTAVSGLAAKPILDLQLSVPSLDRFDRVRRTLEKAGYTYVPGPEPEDDRYRVLVRPRTRPRAFHLHVCEAGSPEEAAHLKFRDRLRADAALAAEYVALKRRLAAARRDDRDAYVDGKTAFVAEVVSSP